MPSSCYSVLRNLLKQNGVSEKHLPRDSVFDTVFTLPSENSHENYNRFEFLGDSILGAVVAKMIFERLPQARVQDLHEIKKELVRNPFSNKLSVDYICPLVDIAKNKLGFEKYIKGNIQSDSQYADVMEALIGAICMTTKGSDSNLKNFIEKMWEPYLYQTISRSQLAVAAPITVSSILPEKNEKKEQAERGFVIGKAEDKSSVSSVLEYSIADGKKQEIPSPVQESKVKTTMLSMDVGLKITEKSCSDPILVFTGAKKKFINMNELEKDIQRLKSWVDMSEKDFPLCEFQQMLKKVNLEYTKKLCSTPYPGAKKEKTLLEVCKESKKRNLDKLKYLEAIISQFTNKIHEKEAIESPILSVPNLITRNSFFQITLDSNKYDNNGVILNTNQKLSAEKIELQNQLTKACYDADLDIVKDLIEKQGADPITPDKNNQEPMAAAIWGLAFNVMNYLEKKISYAISDWERISAHLMMQHQIILPTTIRKIITYRDWKQHHDAKLAPWLYTYEGCKKRLMDDDKMWPQVWHVVGMYETEDLVKGNFVLHLSYVPRTVNYESNIGSEWAPHVYWFNNVCEKMANRLRERGLSVKNDYHLEMRVPSLG